MYLRWACNSLALLNPTLQAGHGQLLIKPTLLNVVTALLTLRTWDAVAAVGIRIVCCCWFGCCCKCCCCWTCCCKGLPGNAIVVVSRCGAFCCCCWLQLFADPLCCFIFVEWCCCCCCCECCLALLLCNIVFASFCCWGCAWFNIGKFKWCLGSNPVKARILFYCFSFAYQISQR